MQGDRECDTMAELVWFMFCKSIYIYRVYELFVHIVEICQCCTNDLHFSFLIILHAKEDHTTDIISKIELEINLGR